MTRTFATLAPAVLLLAACGSNDPNAQRIDAIEDAADNQADAIEDAADTQADRIRSEAESLEQQAAHTTTFDAERLKTRATALKHEAEIARREAAAKSRAIRDKAKADVSAIRAQ